MNLGELHFTDEIFNWYFPVKGKSYRILIFGSGTVSAFKKLKKAVYFADGGPKKAQVSQNFDGNGDLHSFHLFRCSAGQRPSFKLQYKGQTFNKSEAMLKASESLMKCGLKK